MIAISLSLLNACGGGKWNSNLPSSSWSGTNYLTAQSQARRFLSQATFGPTDEDVSTVLAKGASNWLDEQFALPLSGSYLSYFDMRGAQILAANPSFSGNLPTLGNTQFYEMFYSQASNAPDEVRQRVAFALSQIFVVSLVDDNIHIHIHSIPSFYDLLLNDALGNFRQILEDVSKHPAMGLYLSTMNNQKENLSTGLHPDENYAREIMQLFTIGLNVMNQDGTLQLDPAGNPIPTFSYQDISGLAKVFTGWGWYAPTPSTTTYWYGIGEPSETNPMIFYPEYHSVSSKTFLGVTIPASTAPDPDGDLKIAMDTLFNHPNAGPFLATHLIQQLVTSNPNPDYISRVAQAFTNNGAGVRGDMKAVIKAILLDAEATGPARLSEPNYGKLREPVLRLTNWMRAFSAVSQSGYFLMPELSSNASELGESPMDSPSVFNFWSPLYAPPNTLFSKGGLVAPEFQSVNEVSVAGYLNFLESLLINGIGGGISSIPPTNGADIQATYPVEIALADDPEALTTRIDNALCYGSMSKTLHEQIAEAVSSVSFPATPAPPELVMAARINRVRLAVFLTMASPEYLIQR